jgi:IS1 family transposase
MECPNCKSDLIKKNGHTRHGKQNYRCLDCSKQFSEDAESNLITDQTKVLVRRSLLERVSLNGICRIFNISMPWLLDFIDIIIKQLPEDLNAEVTVSEEDEIELVKLEADELWSFVGNKKNDIWLWLVFHSKSRQVLAMQIGPRDKKTAELLFAKLPESLKKKRSTLQTNLVSIMKPFLGRNIDQLEKIQAKQAILKDLTAPSDKDAPD